MWASSFGISLSCLCIAVAKSKIDLQELQKGLSTTTSDKIRTDIFLHRIMSLGVMICFGIPFICWAALPFMRRRFGCIYHLGCVPLVSVSIFANAVTFVRLQEAKREQHKSNKVSAIHIKVAQGTASSTSDTVQKGRSWHALHGCPNQNAKSARGVSSAFLQKFAEENALDF